MLGVPVGTPALLPALREAMDAFNAQNSRRDLWYQESELGFAIELKRLVLLGRKLGERHMGRCYFCVQGNGVVLYSDSLGAAAVILPDDAAHDIPLRLEAFATEALARIDQPVQEAAEA